MASRLLLSRARTLNRLIPAPHLPHSGGIGSAGSQPNRCRDLFGVPVGHGLLRRCSSLPNAKPKSIKKMKKNSKSKPKPELQPQVVVVSLNEAASVGVWPSSARLRIIGLTIFLSAVIWETLDMRNACMEEISELESTIKIQMARKKLLAAKLTGEIIIDF